jgi:hypothetical protein
MCDLRRRLWRTEVTVLWLLLAYSYIRMWEVSNMQLVGEEISWNKATQNTPNKMDRWYLDASYGDRLWCLEVDRAGQDRAHLLNTAL